MSKHLLEDMVKIKHKRREVFKKEPKEERVEIRENSVKEIWKGKVDSGIGTNRIKSRSRYLLWFLALVSVIFCFFAFSFLFSKAEILVNPKTKSVVLNENLSAGKDANDNGLFFNLVVIPGEENKTIQTTEEKDVAIKATGTVLIFNSFSSSPQRLNADTRLEGSNGKIYKTQTQTIVPGMSKGVSGQIEVEIYANTAGSEYNSPPLDFKILGFKGTPKYDKFIGRSKTGTEITGGFNGKSPVLTDVLKTSTINDLKDSLQAKLLKKATDQTPPGFILFKNAVFLNIDEENISLVTGGTDVPVKIKGTLYGILFNEQKLTKKIAEDNIDKYDGSDVFIYNIRDLNFSLFNKDNNSFSNMKNINFSLSGPAKITWKLDENKFAADLLGKPKGNFNQILSQYPNIDSATLTLTPLWRMSIPDQSKDIKVIVNYPK